MQAWLLCERYFFYPKSANYYPQNYCFYIEHASVWFSVCIDGMPFFGKCWFMIGTFEY